MNRNLILLFAATLMLSISCERDETFDNPNEKNQGIKKSIKGPIVYSTWFDWENINRITTGSGIVVDMPWSGTNFLPDRMKHSHPKSEGWEMLYNTLDINNSATTPTLFALYNKYIGIVHIFYVDLWSLESAEGFYGAFSITGNSSLFNFEGNLPSAINDKSYYPMVVKSVEGSINPKAGSEYGFVPYSSFVRNSWYGSEIEFSYENISNYSDVNFYLQYLPYRGKYSLIKLTGDLTGTINGTIEGRSSGNTNLIGSIGNIFSSVTNNNNSVEVNNNSIVSKITGSLEKAKTQATASFWSRLWGKIKKEVPNAAEGAITSTITSAVNQGIKWATNPLSAFVSSVFSIGGSSNSVPLNKVDLKINAKISLSGDITSQIANFKYDLKLPSTISEMGGYGYPTYVMKDWGLGVWNIENLPTINYNITNYIFVINGQAVNSPQLGAVEITLPNANLAKININPKVEGDCNVIKKSIDFIVSTSGDNINFIDHFEPFSFESSQYGSSQSYIFPIDDMVFANQPYHLSDQCGFYVYARATLILQNKTTGKEYVHIKNFTLNKQVNTTYVTGPADELDLPY